MTGAGPRARSGALPASFIGDEADVIARLCDALGLRTIVPYGHSVGGGMAVAMAARWPERCVGVITEAAQSFVEERTRTGIRAAEALFADARQRERLARYHGAKSQRVLDAWIQTWLGPKFQDWRLDEDLRGVTCPLLALHGDSDEYGSVEHPRRIVRLTQGPARMAVLEHCRHVPHREQPERVLEEVERFVATLP